MTPTPPRDHGGNLDAAMARLGGDLSDWVDLSTGINPVPYPVPDIALDRWAALPRQRDMQRLLDAAATTYGASAPLVAMAGAQGAIQAVPFLREPGAARVLGPTYNEHAAALRTGGWAIEEVTSLGALHGADLAVVVNPNNPDGRSHAPDTLLALADHVGLLVVDESFADPEPALSVVSRLDETSENLIVMRSFGKFYGLAGVRLGFAITGAAQAARLQELAGPWPVTGPAIDIAINALSDIEWHRATCKRLAQDAERLDRLAARAGWSLVGGTPLFRTYATPDARAAQEHLAHNRIWSRIFPYSSHWIRLGLPSPTAWEQVETAFTSSGNSDPAGPSGNAE